MKHTELRDGEMFLTNADIEGYSQIGWKTKRKGNIAYDKDEKIARGLFPVFVQKEEYVIGMKKYRDMGL
jgi:hypothetical protein